MQTKFPAIGTTIFTEMSALAVKHNALNLAQGFPNFPCNEQLIELTYHFMKKGFNQYAPMAGALPLRESIATKTEKCYGYKPDINDEITITCGATEAVFSTINAVVSAGDEVIILEPAFDIYKPAIELCGGIAVPVALQGDFFEPDFELIDKAISSKTKMLIINSPHNPTGAVWTNEQMLTLEKLLAPTNILLLSDEVYEHIVFDGKRHYSALEFEGLRKRSFVISSLGKTYHVTGWRVGYVIAPAYLTTELKKLHQYVTFSAHTASQLAFAEIMKDESQYLGLSDFFQEKRNHFLAKIEGSKFKAIPSQGTYFQLLSYQSLSDLNDKAYAIELVEKHGLATIPLSPFYHNSESKLIRICFAKDEQTLNAAADILCKI